MTYKEESYVLDTLKELQEIQVEDIVVVASFTLKGANLNLSANDNN